MSIKKYLVFSFVIIVVALLAMYFISKGIPELSTPVIASNSWSASDGGSTGIELTGSKGKKLSIWVKGSLNNDKKDFPLLFTNHQFVFDIPYFVSTESKKEVELKTQLENWSKTANNEAKLGMSFFINFIKERSDK